MAELLNLSGVEVPTDPAAIFEWIASEVPGYGGLDYDAIGPSGAAVAPVPEEVLR